MWTRRSRPTCFNQLTDICCTLRSGIVASAIIALWERQITNSNLSPQFLPRTSYLWPFGVLFSCLENSLVLMQTTSLYNVEIYIEYVVLSWSPLSNVSVLFLHGSCIYIRLSNIYVVDKKSSRRWGQATTSASRGNLKRIISYSQIIQVRGPNASLLCS